MASIRKTRTGRWQATVRRPDGKPRLRTRFAWSEGSVSILAPKGIVGTDAEAGLKRMVAQLLSARES